MCGHIMYCNMYNQMVNEQDDYEVYLAPNAYTDKNMPP